MEHLRHLAELIDPDARTVADVGAGNGDFAAALAGAGASVTGVEISAEKVARARARHGSVARFVEGRAEALPLADASCDLITFNFSLHHVPADLQASAMDEVRRCLRPGGRLHVVEPDITGAMTGLVALVDDETEIRSQTARFLSALPDRLPLRLFAQRRYMLTRGFDGFDQFLETIVQTDPQRAEKLPAVRAEMQDRFAQTARVVEGRHLFDQPCTAWHFEMIA